MSVSRNGPSDTPPHPNGHSSPPLHPNGPVEAPAHDDHPAEAVASRPPRVRRWLMTVFKVVLTVAAFYLLLTHRISDGEGGEMTTWEAIVSRLPYITAAVFWPNIILAASIKAVGIFSSMTRWYLLLRGQGIRFPFLYLIGTFLIGRFFGTFLPSTLGLDGYKLYDAARGSGHVVEPAAATVVEKILGLSGIFITFLVAFPFGMGLLGDYAGLTAAVTIPLACAAVLAVMLLLLFPAPIVWMLNHLPFPGRNKIEPKIQRIVDASRAYRGKPKLVLSLLGLSFSVHFFTAAMYWFTALAIGAYAPFWRVTLASTIQIVATVVSPLTIAGEGVREIVQALMLAKEMGAGASVLSAALGFWAAEALTLIGGVIWLARKNPGQRARDMFQRGNPISENFDDDIHKNNQVTADTGVTG